MVFNTNILAGSGGQAGDDAFSPVGCKTNNVSIFKQQLLEVIFLLILVQELEYHNQIV